MACQLDQYQDKADEDHGGCDKETHQVEGYGSGVLRGKHCGSRGIIPASRPFLAVGTSRDRSLSCMAAYSGCLCCYLLSERLNNLSGQFAVPRDGHRLADKDSHAER